MIALQAWIMRPKDNNPADSTPAQSGELPVHCTDCGRAVTLFLDLNPVLNAFKPPNRERHHPWLCVWCGAENSIGFDGDIGGVVRGHAATATG